MTWTSIAICIVAGLVVVAVVTYAIWWVADAWYDAMDLGDKVEDDHYYF